mmetsp:Transcript_8516/g.21968  ORF Transcript_8516/g.21968 Transcript_8516/m.21968 type:complete len:211 (-) Transcript_8516:739-1371(-)
MHATIFLDILEEPPVYIIDNLHVPRKKLFHQADGPFLQSFRENCVIGEGEHLCRDFPRLGPPNVVLVHQKTHQLRNAKCRVCVIQLHRHLVRELIEACVLLLVPSDNVLQSCRHHEVLLLQTKLLSFIRPVVRVEHTCDCFCLLLVNDRTDIVTGVKGLQVKFLARLCSPQSQVDGAGCLESRNGVIVCYCCDLFSSIPYESLGVIVLVN